VVTFTYEDLISWAEQLPGWQQDALRRILQTGELSEEDIRQLAELAKAPYLPNRERICQVVLPTLNDIPAPDTSAGAVSLFAIRNIARVNALAEGPILFSPMGLTVVYGENASGKTGIARILKKACRARAPGDRIRPNVFQQDPGQPASATIDFQVGKEHRSHEWAEGREANRELATVHVFDSDCAAIQVDEPNRISYTPAILHIFRLLARACEEIARKLESERTGLGTSPTVLQQINLGGETQAGKFVAGLSAETTFEELDAVCAFGQPEQERLEELGRALSDDPRTSAQAEEARHRRIGELEELTAEAISFLSDEACDALVMRVKETSSAESAAAAAREVFSGNSDLKGIGGDAWRRL
jgi:hypothetical protein